MATSLQVISKKKKFDAFISYNHRSEFVINKIVKKLEDEFKYNLWVDKKKIFASNGMQMQIEDGLRNSEIIICFISTEFCNSVNCNYEMACAVRLKMKRIYVLLENVNTDSLRNRGVLAPGYISISAFEQIKKFEVWFDELYSKLTYSITKLKETIQPLTQ